MLTNGGNGKGLAHELMDEFFGVHAGVKPPKAPLPVPDLEFDANRYVGAYANMMETVEIAEEDGALVATIIPTPAASIIAGTRRVPLQPVNEELFVGVAPGYTETATFHFLKPDAQGRAKYLHSGVRAHRRVTP